MAEELAGWGRALDEIERRETEALALGGETRLVRQRERGRLKARERRTALFDPSTLVDLGTLVGTTEVPPVPGGALAFPSITLRALPASFGGSAIAGPDERRRVVARQANASVTAGSWLTYDDVIDPRELRNGLLAGLALAEGRETAPPTPRRTRI